MDAFQMERAGLFNRGYVLCLAVRSAADEYLARFGHRLEARCNIHLGPDYRIVSMEFRPGKALKISKLAKGF